MPRSRTLSLAVLGLFALWLWPGPTAGAAARLHTQPAASSGAWTAYHHDDAHTGSDGSLPNATGAIAGWVSPVMDQEVYAEPLVYDGIVYAATLNNTVYAFNQSSGHTIWSNHLGAPQAGGWVCGNVSPMGIMGTPVIDTSANRIYALAEIAGNPPTYRLFGLDLATGSILLNTVIAPPGFDWKIQQERGALALANGYVYVPFGGRAGDCFDGSTPYYGWVVGVPTDGVSASNVYQTPSGAESVWAAGGVVVDDASHNVFFATGNAIPCAGSTYSDAVVRVSPTLASPTLFEPSDWQSNWCGPDSDLGSASPVLISPSLMFTAGKRGGGFLLDPANLGGVDGQLYPARSPYQQAEVCLGNHSDATFGSFAYAAPFVYLECDGGGLVALSVNASAPSFSQCDSACAAPDWNASGSTTFGPPIVAGGLVWAASDGGGLSAFNDATGSQVFQSGGFGINRFVTPSEAGGQVFVPSHDVIRSFNMTFLPWVSLGGILSSGPDASSWGASRADLFAVGTDRGLWQDTWSGSAWAGWAPLGGILSSDPGAVSWGVNRIDVFGRGQDGALYHRYYNGSSWSAWEWLGGGLKNGPDVASWAPQRLDIFIVGKDNQLWHKYWDGLHWGAWEPLGGFLTSSPGAVSWGPNRLDIFARGQDGQMWHLDWSGAGWSAWQPLGGLFSSGPDVASCASNRLDVFALGMDKGLWRLSWNGTQWSTWQPLGSQWTSDPSAVCLTATSNVDLFERGSDQAIWTATVTGS